MKRLSGRLILLAIWMSAAMGANAAEESSDVAPEGEASLSLSTAKASVEIKLKNRRIEGDLSQSEKLLLAPDCPLGVPPCSLLEEINIGVSGRALPVPRSVFRGLPNVRAVKLTTHGPLFRMTLRGADASESYLVRIEFNQSRILKRQISSALAPTDFLEETIYRRQTEYLEK
jgi:hypothetical protein